LEFSRNRQLANKTLNLLPCPRVLKRAAGWFRPSKRIRLQLDSSLPRRLQVALTKRLQNWNTGLPPGGNRFSLETRRVADPRCPTLRAVRGPLAPPHAEGYALKIDRAGIAIDYHDLGGLRAAVATLRQLLREYGGRLPCLQILDWPDFSRRGVMLDISRGRVPRLKTLLELVDQLADFKINEFQLYIEHTFAYRNYRPVWRDWGALTGKELSQLEARCVELGIDLVPNQNSFGHLRSWLEYPPLKKLAEVSEPYEAGGGDFLRFPSTIAPNHPGTLPFLRGLYDELLPHFSSRLFNVGCDEPWDLGRGQSRKECERKGKGRVYLGFLKAIHAEISARGRRMMFWGDIVLRYPELLGKLPKDVLALNWGYEADHPFDREAELFAKSGVSFYVCPGTSTWMTLIGRHDNALANLRAAAKAGRKHGAAGYLITDWGDGGHPQPLAVSYLPYLAGAASSWCARTFDKKKLERVLSRDVFADRTGRMARAASGLGLAHLEFGYFEPNATPFGTVLGAPPKEARELFCRHGLTHYRHIPEKNVRAARAKVEAQRARLRRSRPGTALGKILATELEFAACMAGESCRFMLWQQALAAGNALAAGRMARSGIRELRALSRAFDTYWPIRNKGLPKKCSGFLGWRIADYTRGTLP